MVVSIRESDYRRLPPQAEEVVRRIVQQTNPYGCAPRGILTFECTDEEWQMIQEKMKVLTNG